MFWVRVWIFHALSDDFIRVAQKSTCNKSHSLLITAMKILSPVLLLVIGVSTCNGDAIALKKVVPSMASYHTRKLHFNTIALRRQLELSDQCIDATEALYNTTEILSANQAWVAEIEVLEGDCNQSGNAGTCILDSKTLNTHDAFMSACTNAGGTPALFSDSFSCSVTENDATAQIDFEFVDIPECIMPSCDEEVGRELVGGFVEQSAKLTEQSLSTEFDSVLCTEEAPTSLAYSLDPKASFVIVSSMALAWLVL